MRSESAIGIIKLAHTFYEPQDGLVKRKRRFRVIYSCVRETREKSPIFTVLFILPDGKLGTLGSSRSVELADAHQD